MGNNVDISFICYSFILLGYQALKETLVTSHSNQSMHIFKLLLVYYLISFPENSALKEKPFTC